MTTLALFAEMTVMFVVILVTRHTGHVEPVGKRVGAVARIAILLRVGTVEYEAGIARMVERRLVPAKRTVASAALIPAATVMRIILRMTSETGRWRVTECVIGVTIQARGFLVPADQRVACQVVIELDVEPGIGRVTVATLCAQRVRMRVVLLVARETVARCVTMSDFRCMAAAALAIGVTSDQGKVRVIVIEVTLIEPDDIGIPAFVVRVTVCTRRPARTSILTMKA